MGVGTSSSPLTLPEYEELQQLKAIEEGKESSKNNGTRENKSPYYRIESSQNHNGIVACRMDQSAMVVPDVLLTPYVMYDIISEGRIDKFELAIDILEELVIFGKHYNVRIPDGIQLLQAMKLKYVLELIQKQTPHVDVSWYIEKYFPSTSRSKQEKNSGQQHVYRKFLNILTEKRDLQISFFEKDYTREFGTEFLKNMTEMTENLLLKIVPMSEIIKGVRTEAYIGIAKLDSLVERLNVLSAKRTVGVQDVQSVLSLSISYRTESPVSDVHQECPTLPDIRCSTKTQKQEQMKQRVVSAAVVNKLFESDTDDDEVEAGRDYIMNGNNNRAVTTELAIHSRENGTFRKDNREMRDISEQVNENNKQKDSDGKGRNKYTKYENIPFTANTANISMETKNRSEKTSLTLSKMKFTKCSKSLFDVLDGNRNQKEEEGENRQSLLKTSRREISSQFTPIPSFKVGTFYTSLKEVKVNQAKPHIGTNYSAADNAQSDLVSNSTDIFKQHSDSQFGKRIKRSRRHQHRTKYGKTTYKQKRKTSLDVAQPVDNTDKHLISTDKSRDVCIVDVSDINKNKVPGGFVDQTVSDNGKEMPALKATKLTYSNVMIHNKKKKEKDFTENTAMEYSCYSSTPEVAVSNHNAEEIQSCDSVFSLVFEINPSAEKMSSANNTRSFPANLQEAHYSKEMSLECLGKDSGAKKDLLSAEVPDFDKVIPSSVEGSPIYSALKAFEGDASYLDNEVQYMPDFSKFLFSNLKDGGVYRNDTTGNKYQSVATKKRASCL